MTFKSVVREMAARLGVHVSREAYSPERTLLGIRTLTIGTVFDVGSNVGQYAKFMREVYPLSEIHCFEPGPVAFEALNKWVQEDGRARAVQLALGAEEGACEFHVHVAHTPSSSLLATTSQSHSVYPVTVAQQRVEVRVARLDNYVSGLPEPPANDWLMKIDVQGFEASVLKGAPLTLQKLRACIVEVCLDPLYVGQGTFGEVHALLSAAGLSYAGNINQVYGPDGHVIYLDALFRR